MEETSQASGIGVRQPGDKGKDVNLEVGLLLKCLLLGHGELFNNKPCAHGRASQVFLPWVLCECSCPGCQCEQATNAGLVMYGQ